VENYGNIYPGYAQPATRNYEYLYPSQVVGDPPFIVMHSSSSAANASSSEINDDPVPGFEVTYSRELFRTGSVRWSLESAFGYSDLSVSDNSTYSAGVTTINDAFGVPPMPIELGGGPGVVPSPGPSSGGVNTPLLDSTPVRSITGVAAGAPGSASITGQHGFNANLYEFRLGPGVEFPLSRKLALSVSAGFALVYAESDFSFNENVSIPGVGSVNHAGSAWQSGWLPGGYAAVNLSLTLSERWALTAGAQFEDVGQYSQTLNGKQATLDLSNSIFVTLGITYSF
jgi:hypothetical protein